MAKRYVLCVLSQMYSNARPYRFTFENHDISSDPGDFEGKYCAIQTNVSPVECLIDLANEAHLQDKGLPVISKVIYLCSKECRVEIQGITDISGETTTAESYFRQKVYEYYVQHLPDDAERQEEESFFLALDYEPLFPEKYLQAIIRATESQNIIVDVDTTGGLRDAVNLLTLAIEVLQRQSQTHDTYPHPVLGTTVYARIINRADSSNNYIGAKRKNDLFKAPFELIIITSPIK